MAKITISTISGEDLARELDDTGLYLVDVREPDEVEAWSIPGAHNFPLALLESMVDGIPREKDLVVVCAKGARARQGAGLLAEHGLASRVLEGGMESWSSTYDHVSGEFAGATVVQIRRRGKGCLSYVVGAGERAVVIDPSRDLDQYLEVATRLRLDDHPRPRHSPTCRSLERRPRTRRCAPGRFWLNPADPFTFDFEPLVDGKSIELAPGVDLECRR